jgi:hypothetical protein
MNSDIDARVVRSTSPFFSWTAPSLFSEEWQALSAAADRKHVNRKEEAKLNLQKIYQSQERHQ